jgi:hypothetical protein
MPARAWSPHCILRAAAGGWTLSTPREPKSRSSRPGDAEAMRSLDPSMPLRLVRLWVRPPFGFVHRNAPKCKILIFKENWTSGTSLDTLPMSGGQRAMSSCLVLPMTDDLVPRQGRGLWVESFWRSESIVTVLRPNSSGLRPIARYQLAQSQFVPREGEHLDCGDGTAGQLGHCGHGVSPLDSGISGPASVPALVGPLACGVVDLDTVEPPDQDQDLVHTGYTRRSQTSKGCQRST